MGVERRGFVNRFPGFENKPSFEMKGFGAVGLTHKYEFKNELKQ